ncbi:MAG: DUF5522 domain-containing protein, partial [Chitinophagales bacterium]
ERGYCCRNGCRHCPYNYLKKKEHTSVKPDGLHRQNAGNDNRGQ